MAKNNLQLQKQGLGAMYAIGFKLYENGKYKEAVDVFRVLTVLDKEQKKHWLGLGASYQQLKDYDRALQSYAYAALLDERDPFVHFHAAECFLSQKKLKEGVHVLNIAKTVALDNKDVYNQLLTRIDLIKGGLDRLNGI